MKNVLLLGGGKIGFAIAEFLSGSGDYRVTVADRDGAALARMPATVERRKIAIEDAESLAREIAGHEIVVSATPYFLNATIAEAARMAGAHYLDLTEDVAATRFIQAVADGAPTALFPNAVWRPALSRSQPMILPVSSTACAMCRCGSVPCRCFRPMR